MKKTAWVIIVPGLLLATAAAALMILMSLGSPRWTCTCDGSDHWQYVGADGIHQGRMHLEAIGHSTSCKRTDWAAKVMDRVFSFIFPGHEA